MDEFEKLINRNPLLQEVVGLAKRGYTNLPYHNFDHAKNTFVASEKFASQCEEAGASVDRLVTGPAALYHDYDFAKAPEAKFSSKESRSANRAERDLTSVLGHERVKRIGKCILATHIDASCETIEEKITVRADIENVSSSFAWFFANFFRLQHERIHLNPKSAISIKASIETTENILRKYLQDRDLSLPGDKSSPLEQMLSNMVQLKTIGQSTLDKMLHKVDEEN